MIMKNSYHWLGILSFLAVFGMQDLRGQQTGSAVEFATLEFYGDEDAGSVEVEVIRTGDPDAEVTVDYRASAHIATAGVDFVPVSGTVSFAAGEESAMFSVEFLDDGEMEGSEPIILTLTNPSSPAVLGERAEALLYVQDNEHRGTIIDWSFENTIGPRDRVRDLALLPDGRIVAVGEFERTGSPIVDRIIVLQENGTRDSSFDMVNGIPDSTVLAVAVQEDGGILVGGYFTAVGSREHNGIARFAPDGSLDESFDAGAGMEGTDPRVYTIVVQEDGKILVGGVFTHFADEEHLNLVRLDSDGSPDPDFDIGSGFVSTDADFEYSWVSVILLDPEGRILVSGHFNEVDGIERAKVVRLQPDGSVDESFDPGGSATGPLASIEAMALQSDGRILIGGDFDNYDDIKINGIARIRSDGLLDDSFDPGTGARFFATTGGQAPGWVGGIHVFPDGEVLLIGFFDTIDEFGRPGIGRVHANGIIDGRFGPYSGTTYFDEQGYEEFFQITAMIPLEDGRVIVGATYRTPNGNLVRRINRLLWRNITDNTVEMDRLAVTVSEGIPVAEVLVIRRGESDSGFSVDYRTTDGSARAAADYVAGAGTLDFAALETEMIVEIPILDDALVEENESFTLALHNPSGEVIIGDPGSTGVTLVDSLRTGNPDPGFDAARFPVVGARPDDPPISDILIQDDGKVLVSGNFSRAGEHEVPGLARFLSDGILDDSYQPELDDADLGTIRFSPMVLTSADRALGGRENLRLLDREGRVDDSFRSTVTFVTALAMLDDGSVLVGSDSLDPSNGEEYSEVILLDAAGQVDSAFLSPFFNDPINVITPLRDGKILVGGWFSQMDGEPTPPVVRLHSDGTEDTTFDNGNFAVDSSVFSIVEDEEGRLLVGGQFPGVEGVQPRNIARINANGTVDDGFALSLGADLWVEDIALDAEGRILIGGGFNGVENLPRPGLARLLPDGSPDEDFSPDFTYLGRWRFVSRIVVGEDGGILVGGSFSRVNGLPYSGLVRLNGGSTWPEPGTDEPLNIRIDPVGTAPELAVRLTVDLTPGREWRIESSENLRQWQLLDEGTATGNTVVIEESAGEAVRFYRALLQGP